MKEKSWLMIVARAAPLHPPPEAVDEDGSRMMLVPAPRNMESMAPWGAVSADEVVHPHAGDGEDRADEDDAQIPGIRHDLLTGPEGGERGSRKRRPATMMTAQREEIMPGRTTAASSSRPGRGGWRRGSPADPVEHPHRQEDDHDGEADRDAGDPVGPEAGGVADIDAVDDVVEGVDHHADDRREAETPEEAGDGLDAKGVLCESRCIHVSSVLLLYTPVGCPNRRRGVHTPHRR